MGDRFNDMYETSSLRILRFKQSFCVEWLESGSEVFFFNYQCIISLFHSVPKVEGRDRRELLLLPQLSSCVKSEPSAYRFSRHIERSRRLVSA